VRTATGDVATHLYRPGLRRSAPRPAACKGAPVSNLDQRGVKRTTATRSKCDIGAYDTGGKA
jgi:hypothetical protein